MIDSHCHLTDKAFAGVLDDVLLRAEENGVNAMVCIADTLEESVKGIQLAEKYDQLFCTVGVHPHHAKDWSGESGDRVRSLIQSSGKVKAVGEIGLDYHYDFSPRDIQKQVFREQLEIAKELNMPAVVHCREAIDDVRSIVEEVNPPSLVLHCCCEKWGDVEWAVERGYLLSFTGIITYNSAHEIRETVKQCPLESMMVETDAPYLAPVPFRGKTNEPAFVVEVAKKVAEIKGIELEEVDRVTTENAMRFYSL